MRKRLVLVAVFLNCFWNSWNDAEKGRRLVLLVLFTAVFYNLLKKHMGHASACILPVTLNWVKVFSHYTVLVHTILFRDAVDSQPAVLLGREPGGRLVYSSTSAFSAC